MLTCFPAHGREATVPFIGFAEAFVLSSFRRAGVPLQRIRPAVEVLAAHRRGGYRDPESQTFIESWFSKLKKRLVWRSEFETLDEARAAVAAYVETYHHRPHSGLGHRTPKEVRETWEDAQGSEASTDSRGLG